jgi:histidinol-phosphatase (PHP family)
VHEIPIDYDAAMYAQAVARSGGTEEKLYADYFEQQFEMLGALRPRVVGHFDLIRLLSSEPERDLRDWEKVWGLVRRNLERVVRDGGMLEVNSSALRKGLREPYPGRRICEVF